jgi:hypothetical protein
MEPTLLEKEQVHLSRRVNISWDELWSMYGMVTRCQGSPDLQHLSSFNQCFSTTTTCLLLLEDISVSSPITQLFADVSILFAFPCDLAAACTKIRKNSFATTSRLINIPRMCEKIQVVPGFEPGSRENSNNSSESRVCL